VIGGRWLPDSKLVLLSAGGEVEGSWADKVFRVPKLKAAYFVDPLTDKVIRELPFSEALYADTPWRYSPPRI